MENLYSLKPEEAQAKLDELNGVPEEERTDGQKSDITSIDSYFKEIGEYNELAGKDKLTDDEEEKFVSLGEKLIDVDLGKAKEPPKPKEGEEPPAGTEKKFAGVYNTVEALLDGINSSEGERKKILANLSEEDKVALEDFYKGSQRKVTKAVEFNKGKAPDAGGGQAQFPYDLTKIPLNERRLDEITKDEYNEWEKKDKFAAQSWLNGALRLHESREASVKKVYAKHPEFLAMNMGVLPASKEFIEFDKIATERTTEFRRDTDGPWKCLAETYKNLGMEWKEEGAPIAPKVLKPPKKPSITGGPAGGSGKKPVKKVLSDEEYEALSDDEKDKYQAESVGL